MGKLYEYPVYHVFKLTDVRTGRCTVLVREKYREAHYHTGARLERRDYCGNVGTRWVVSIEGEDATFTRKTRRSAIRAVLIWWDRHVSDKTGRPIERRIAVLDGGDV